MSGPDASADEMAGFPLRRRRASELDEPVLDALLTGQSLPADAPGQARAMVAMLASLASPAGSGPLAGEASARSAFARAASPAGISPASRAARRSRGRPSRGRRQARLRFVTAAVAISAVLGSVAAAWAGVLPAPVQELAHQVFGVPAASRPAPRPPATGHSASVLCVAYERARTHGGPRAMAAAHARLAKAAGGASRIGRYCGKVVQPGAGQAGHGAAGHGTRKHGGPGNRAKVNGHAKAKGHASHGVHGQSNGHGGKPDGHAPAGGRTGHSSHGGL